MKVSRDPERIVVLGGGISAEREVSLASSRAVFEALSARRQCDWVDVTEACLPPGLNPKTDLIFPVLHGTFGEDGRLQRLLDEAGFAYVGCGAEASALCMDKVRTKRLVGAAGVPVCPQLVFRHDEPVAWSLIVDTFGQSSVVLKPSEEGSSVGLCFVNSEGEWIHCCKTLKAATWMVEPRLAGHDVTVGVLAGEAMGVVGIFPEGGASYDYVHKYTAGKTRYEFPADLPLPLTEAIRLAAVRSFSAVDARDFARVDFMRHGDRFTFLEINTIPGLTATSLLPKSASVMGLDFSNLVERMLAPALARFQCREAYKYG